MYNVIEELWHGEMDFIKLCLMLTTVLYCDGVGVHDESAHKVLRRAKSRRGPNMRAGRRYFGGQVILGAPSHPSHVPPAEPILPGHTLIKPALGMLKSAIKFPHREQENGSGVYGHIDTIGIRYDGKNERLMYSKFRRMPSRRNLVVMLPEKYSQQPITIEEYFRSYGRRDGEDQTSPEREPLKKNKLFWNTEDSFNHIKINPDAPDHRELIPSTVLEDVVLSSDGFQEI